MIPYCVRTGTRSTLAALREHGWRLLVSARGRVRTEGMPYALDNGAWTSYQKGEPFDEAAFAVALDAIGRDADFVVVPDIVCGGLRSLELSMQWLPRVLGAAPVALIPVQPGMQTEHVASLCGPRVGLFVGGDDAWKDATIPEWSDLGRRIGCWVHVGRVNTRRRMLACLRARATSCDGASVARFPSTLDRFERALSEPIQTVIWLPTRPARTP